MFIELKQEGRKWGIKESVTDKVSFKLVALLLSISLIIFVGLPGVLMVLENIRKNNPFKPPVSIVEAKERFKIAFPQKRSFEKVEPPKWMGQYQATDNPKRQRYVTDHIIMPAEDRSIFRPGAKETPLTPAPSVVNQEEPSQNSTSAGQ